MNYKSAIAPIKQMCKQLNSFVLTNLIATMSKPFTKDKLLDSN